MSAALRMRSGPAVIWSAVEDSSVTISTTARHLSDAALAIAKANHYMVGFDPDTTAGLSFDECSDAHTLLVDRENMMSAALQGMELARMHLLYNRAFAVLDVLCFRLHRTHLGT